VSITSIRSMPATSKSAISRAFASFPDFALSKRCRSRSNAVGRHRGHHPSRGEARRRPSLDDPAPIWKRTSPTARLIDAARRWIVANRVRLVVVRVRECDARAIRRECAAVSRSRRTRPATAGAPRACFAHLYPLKSSASFFTVYGRGSVRSGDPQVYRPDRPGRPVRCMGWVERARLYYITDCVDGIVAGLEWTAGAAPGTVRRSTWRGDRVRLDRLIALIATALGQEARIERQPDQPGDVRFTDADLATPDVCWASSARRHRGRHPQVRRLVRGGS